VKPGVARTDDVFLHMIQVGDASLRALPEVTLDETDDALSMSFTYAGKDYSLSFNKKSAYGCTLTVK
jgi:heparin/heparan-sulfate lyase